MGDDVFSLKEIKQKSTKLVELKENCCWLALTNRDGIIDFGVFEFSLQRSDIDDVFVQMIFYGYGMGDFENPSNGLRELRHTYFAPARNGYIFYLSMETMRLAFDELSKYFDER